MTDFNGLGLGLGNLARLSKAQTRSISAENFTGEKGAGGMATTGTGVAASRDLGQGWKISPSIAISPGELVTLADIKGSGAIQHLWMTTHYKNWRSLILWFYWEASAHPAVGVPLGDFFCNGWCEYSQVNSLPIAVNPNGGFNSYWKMPFRQAARITIESLSDEEIILYYQVDYTLTDVPDDVAYFHAQWRRSNPLPYKHVHTLLDGIQGSGHYVGTYIAWGPMTPAGGARARPNSTSMATLTIPPFAVPERKTTSAAPGTLMCRIRGTLHSQRRSLASIKYSVQTACIAASSDLACTAGTSWIPSAFSRI